MRKRWFLALWALLLSVGWLTAQDETDDITPGAVIEGTLNNRQPRQVFYFEGSKGEVLRVQVIPTSGDVDLVLVVFDENGTIIFSQDDMAGSREITTTLTIQENTRYFVVVGRFGYEMGSTSGDFELLLERVGVISEPGTNLLYGIPILNTITNTQPQIYYTFQANEGDIVDIVMERSSGTLDPYLQVVDSNRFIVAENDDEVNGNTKNAHIENLVIQTTGTYIVIATRYGQTAGQSIGSFVLSVNQAANSGIGNSNLAPLPILFNQPVEDILNDEQFARYYSFTAQRDDIITISMEQVRGQLDSYLVLANAGLLPLVENDDTSSGRNAKIERYRLPADGLYYIIAQRADGEEGTSNGTYRLTLQREGSAFETVDPAIPRLEYGTIIQDTITNEDVNSLFAFWADNGDNVIINMNRANGDLDAVLELLDSEQRLLQSDDDGGGGQNAQITYTIRSAGIYYIRAARYSGTSGVVTTTGAYNLLLSRTLAP